MMLGLIDARSDVVEAIFAVFFHDVVGLWSEIHLRCTRSVLILRLLLLLGKRRQLLDH